MAKARTGTQPGAGSKSSHRGGKARTVTQHGVGAKRTKSFGKKAKANPQLSKVNRKGFSWR